MSDVGTPFSRQFLTPRDYPKPPFSAQRPLLFTMMNEEHHSLYDELELLAQFQEPVITRRRPPLPRIQTSFTTSGEVDAVWRHDPQLITLPNQEDEYHGLPQATSHDFHPYFGEPPVSTTPSLFFDSLTSAPVNNASQGWGMDVDPLFDLVDTDVKGQSDSESYYAESEGQPEESHSDYSDNDDSEDDDDQAPSHAYTQFVLPTWQVTVPSTPPPSPQTLLDSGPPLPPSITIITPPPTAYPTATTTDQTTHPPDIPCSTFTIPSSPDITTTNEASPTPSSNTPPDSSSPLRCRLRFRNGLRCNATFTTPLYLARHKRMIHPRPNWAKICIFCRYRLCFTERSAYVRHLDRVHGMREDVAQI